MLHYNICESEKLASVSPLAETLYYRLMTRVDDNGNYTANPRIVYGQCMILRDGASPENVEEWLQELATNGDMEPLIKFYEVDGKKFLHITRFDDFQNLKNKFDVRYPENSQDSVKITDVENKEDKKPGENFSKNTSTTGINNLRASETLLSSSYVMLGSSSGGSGGNWKNIATHYRTRFRIAPSEKGGRDAGYPDYVKMYLEACGQYTEDRVLAAFDSWAAENPRLNDNEYLLGLFFKNLDVIIESDAAIAIEERANKPSEVSQVDLDAHEVRVRQEVQNRLDEIDTQRAFDEAHKDEI